MTVDATRAAFFLNTDASIFEYETLEIDHTNMAAPIYLVRNNRYGLTATLETAAEVTFVYVPMKVTRASLRGDMDSSMKFALGDLGEIIPDQLDAIRTAGGLGEKPTVKFRTFRSDDLSAPFFGPITLEMRSLPRSGDGAAFDASPPRLNLSRTGIRYAIADQPQLRALL